MKNTEELDVISDLYLKTDLIIHPNTGFDLGLMNTKYPVKIFGNTTVEVFNTGENDFFNGNIILSNTCEHEKISMPSSLWKKMGMPRKVRLYYEDGKLLVAGINA